MTEGLRNIESDVRSTYFSGGEFRLLKSTVQEAPNGIALGDNRGFAQFGYIVQVKLKPMNLIFNRWNCFKI